LCPSLAADFTSASNFCHASESNSGNGSFGLGFGFLRAGAFDMAYTRELTKEEVRFCAALGGVVIFWNHIDWSMRTLLQRATILGSMNERVMVLVPNLGNVALTEAMTAIADDHEEDRASHLKHCAALFDAERIYRNYYVHNPFTFLSTESDTKSLAMHVTAKGGALKVHRGHVTAAQLETFHDRLSALGMYIGEIIQDSIDSRGGKPLSSLEKPPLPDKLELNRLRLIEQRRPLQSSAG
jgi:hypothetical protein